MNLKRYLTVFLAVVVIFLHSCSEAPMKSENKDIRLSNKDIDSALRNVAEMRIFFGHQSVGKNILDGISDISKDTNHKINIFATRGENVKNEAAFFHAKVGNNTDPLSKITDFRELVKNGIGDNVDVAFFKFCYIDFDQTTDIKRTFNKYQQTMKTLKENYPQTTFVHFTVPLVDARLGIKDYIKKIIGRYNTKLEGNIKRNQFNTMLRAEYEGKEPIFDLAVIESTYSDGKRETFYKGEGTYYSLVPAYTDDGSHLNKTGRKVVASKLLSFLASL